MANKSLLTGIVIGAGAALGVREVVQRLRHRRNRKQYLGRQARYEPDDSRTYSHVPDSGQESYPGYLRHFGADESSWRRGAWTRAEQESIANRQPGGLRPGTAKSLRRDINAIGDRERNREEGNSQGGINVQQNRNQTGRTSTNTESELRRTGTDDNPIRYTRPPEPPTTSGSEAPFIKDEE